jgi:hypothetical protein
MNFATNVLQYTRLCYAVGTFHVARAISMLDIEDLCDHKMFQELFPLTKYEEAGPKLCSPMETEANCNHGLENADLMKLV